MEETEVGTLDGSSTGRRPHEPRRLAKGDVVGRYVIVDMLGAGGMGVVHAAYDPELDRRVALKLLQPREAGSTASKGRARLVREAQALARLNHPNVVTVHDVGEHEGRVFVAMEFIDGITLKAWMKQGPHSWQDVVDVMTRAGRGLVAAHAKEMSHRDFKPDNVMLQGDGPTRRVVVMDFGLATAPTLSTDSVDFDPETSASAPLAASLDLDFLTRTGAVMGTPAYMAPEQHAGSPGAQSDQFSYCVTLYEALYGKRPYRGATLAEQVATVTRGELDPAPANDTVPAWLREVVVRGLAPSPEARWPSMRALLEAMHPAPSRSRSFVVAGLTLAAVGAGVLATDRIQTRRTARACDDEAALIEAVWSEAQRSIVRDAFASSPLPYAQDAWGRVEGRLDGVADRWSSSRRESCLARASLPEDRRAVQDACFDARMRQLASVVETLSEPDAGTIRGATQMIQLAPEDCVDERWLRTAAVPDEEPADTEARATVQGRVARARALRAAGRFEDALILVDTQLDAAEALDDDRLRALAGYERGRVLGSLRRFEDCTAALEDAYFAAMRASSRRLALKAARRLVAEHGHGLANATAGRRWARHAELLLDPDDHKGRARLDVELARVEFTAGNIDRALPLAEAARTLAEAEDGPYASLTINAKELLVALYDRSGNIDEAIELSLEVLDARREVYGPEHPETLSCESDLAATLISKEDYAGAEAHARVAIGVGAADDLRKAAALDNLSLAIALQGRLDEASTLNAQVLKIRRAQLPEGHVRIANTLVNNANLLFQLGQHEAALERALEAKDIYTRNPDADTIYQVSPLRIIGASQSMLGHHDDAITNVRRAHQIRAAKLGAAHPETLRVMAELGMVFHAAGKPLEIVAMFEPHVPPSKAFDALPPDIRVTLLSIHGRAALAAGTASPGRDSLTRGHLIATKTGCCDAMKAVIEIDQARDRWQTANDDVARAKARGEVSSITDRLEELGPEGDPTEVERARTWLKQTEGRP